jgi:hypothetical protein
VHGLTIEEIRYDFTEHAEHFRNFFSKILKIMIISKLNCQESNKTSASYFNRIIGNIDHCETHRVKYGKPMIFTKFFHFEFTYQTIKVTIKITGKHIIDIQLESIIPDFVKFFDELSSDTKAIQWNNTSLGDNVIQERMKTEKNENSNGDSPSIPQQQSEEKIQQELKTIFCILETFIETLYDLTSISPNENNDSLIGKTIEIKDVSLVRKSLIIEIVIDEKTIIMNLSPKKNKHISIILDNDDKTGNTIKELIIQNKKF